MLASALAPSPLARLLLDLARREVDGSVEVGGRRIVLRSGEVVDVEPAEHDPGFGPFLVDAGRLRPEELEAVGHDGAVSFAEALVRDGKLPARAVQQARRALWLDRLVAGIADDEQRGRESPVFLPAAPQPHRSPSAAEEGEGADLATLVLDAFARRASEGGAEQVGTRADHRLLWVDGELRQTAQRWCELTDEHGEAPRVAQLLTRSPAGAARIAALVRVGLAHLSPPGGSAPPPPRRPASVAPPGPVRTGNTARFAAVPEPPAVPSPPQPTAPPPAPELRTPALQLEPGAGDPPSISPPAAPLWRLPAAGAPLSDPLDPVERRIAGLEQAGAPGPERAAAWRELARIWQREYGSLPEAARAWREAAAADPADIEALEESAVLCAAAGLLEHACAYAEAAAREAEQPQRKARAVRRCAEMALRAGRSEQARAALREATELDVDDPEAPEWLARLAYRLGDVDDAVRHACEAARRLRTVQPERARGLLAWSCTLRPDDPELLDASATALAQDGFDEAAVSLLAEAARAREDVDERRRLQLAAAERAELSERPDLAAWLLCDAFAREPHLDVLYEPLDADLRATGEPSLRAAVLEQVARRCPQEERSRWLLAAAEVHRELATGQDWALELTIRALEADPRSEQALETLRSEADDALLADALERAAQANVRRDPAASIERLCELAEIAELRLGATRRAAWSWARIADIHPGHAEADAQLERIRGKMRLSHQAVEQAERELEGAGPDGRPRAARKLAALIREHPDDRARAVALYREASDARPDDAAALSSLERLLRLERDDYALLALFERRLRSDAGRREEVRLLSWVAGLEALGGEHEHAADACRRLLPTSADPGLALARFELAARFAGDPALQRSALEHRVHWDSRPAARARALAELALQLESDGEENAAVERARQALETDPRVADAAVLRLRYVDELPPNEALQVVEHARRVLGNSPPLLELAARVAARAGDHERRVGYLDAWYGLAPTDPEAVRLRLADAVAGEDAIRVLETAQQALARDVIDEHTANAVHTALERLEALGAYAEAAALATFACDRIGEHHGTLLALARWLTEREGGSSKRRVAVLEREIARATRPQRVEPLRELAAVHRDRGDRAGEARTLLRIIEVVPRDPHALERLASIYAEAGETERLMAVLSLRLESAEGPEQRRERLLDLAAAAAQAAGDLDEAERFVRAMIDEASEGEKDEVVSLAASALVALGDRDRAVAMLLAMAPQQPPERAGAMCEHAIALAEREAADSWLALRTATRALELAPDAGGVLLAFERLALQLGDVATARQTYEQLIERAAGRHGQRALLYRQARWLERAGDPSSALDCYLRAFEHSPSEGVSYRAIERLCAELAEWEPLVRATSSLAAQARQPDRHIGYACRIAEVCDRELGDPRRAFSVLCTAWEQTGAEELFGELLRLAARVAAADEPAGADAHERLRTTLEHWAEQAWDVSERARYVRALLRLWASREELGRAGERIERELAEAVDEPQPLLEPLLDVVEWEIERGHEAEAARHLQQARALEPDSERIGALARRLAPAEARSPQQTGEMSPVDGPDPLESTIRLAEGIAEDPARQREATQLLLGVVRTDPTRVGALRSLHSLARRIDATALANAAAAVLALFDPTFEPPDEASLGRSEHFVADVYAAARDEECWQSVFDALRIAWESASPLFRGTPRDYDVLGTERVAPLSRRPAARVYAEVLQVLDPGEVALYLRPTQSPLTIALIQPPAVIAGPDLEEQPDTMRFRLGRAVELARPEHVLVAGRLPERTDLLLRALWAAFAPAEAACEADGPAAALAADLWRTIPARAQARLRQHVTEAGPMPDAPALRDEVHAAGARAGLAVAVHVRDAVQGLVTDDPSLAHVDAGDPDRLADACRASRSLLELLRFALSDACIAARARALAA